MGVIEFKNILEEETQGEKSRYQLRQGNEGNIYSRKVASIGEFIIHRMNSGGHSGKVWQRGTERS